MCYLYISIWIYCSLYFGQIYVSGRLNTLQFVLEGTRWHNWLMHCATSRKVAGSIPDYIIGIFH